MSTNTDWEKLFPDAEASEVEALIDGDEYFDSVVDAIRTAKNSGHYIYILGWMLDLKIKIGRGRNRKSLGSHLLDAAKSGVKVRILYWDNPTKFDLEHSINLYQQVYYRKVNDRIFVIKDSATFVIPKVRAVLKTMVSAINNFKNNMRNTGNPHYWVLSESLLNSFPSEFQKGLDWAKRNKYSICAHHEKNVVVKGSKGLIAFCGGIDFNKNRQSSQKEYYHDVGCRLTGKAAFDIQSKFMLRWKNHPLAGKINLHSNNSIPPGVNTFAKNFPLAKIVGTYNSPNNGVTKDRSLSDAYFRIINNAKKYIYIEDQYLVNIDIARAINKKISEPDFELAMFVVQDASKTDDIKIPNRKRHDFIEAIKKGRTPQEQAKVLYTVVDRTKQGNHHKALHSKVLMVDDEIVMIGSANVNQRSFTLDSETSAIIIDTLFVFNFRKRLWEDFFITNYRDIRFDDWRFYPEILRNPNSYKTYSDASMLKKYLIPDKTDLDKKVIAWIKGDNLGWVSKTLLKIKSKELQKYFLNPIYSLDPTKEKHSLSDIYKNPENTVPDLFNILWDNIIDPKI